jgi:hypothetical protein
MVEKPESSKQVPGLVAGIVELAAEGVLDIGRPREIEQEVIETLDDPSPRNDLE